MSDPLQTPAVTNESIPLTSAGPSTATRVLVTLAAAVVVIAGFSLGREIIGPFALAAVVVVLVHPVRGIVERRGVPGWVASIVVVLCAYLILAAMIFLLVLAADQFVALLQSSSDQIMGLYDSALSIATGWGLDSSTLTGLFDPTSLIGAAGSLLGSVSGIGGAFLFTLAYIAFMAVDASRFNHIPSHIARVSAPIVESFARFSHSVRIYFGVNAIFGLIVAVLDGALLSGGWVVALIVIAAYIVINVVLQTLVQPKFVSDAVHLSLTLTFASVIFWTFVIGALGALLAVPLTLLLRELLIGTDKRAVFSAWITSDDPTPSKQPA